MHEQSIHADVYAAIDKSAMNGGGAVHLPYSQEASNILWAESEDSTGSKTVLEFWGKGADGNTWRVHLDR